MNQAERRRYLIDAFLAERPELAAGVDMPTDAEGQRRLLRALLNTRQPGLPAEDVLRAQDAYLQERLAQKGVTRLSDLASTRAEKPRLFLWQGDITTLAADAIVNAANEGMTGCWTPNHSCIDNAIHTFAGVQLRWECARLMERQGRPEGTGLAKVTGAYNLPCRFVVHTVGPIAQGRPTPRHRLQLEQCYRSCYEAARDAGATSLAYCCIGTGVFGFPCEEAARIAVSTVRELQEADAAAGTEPLDVVFNVFLDRDREIYRTLL